MIHYSVKLLAKTNPLNGTRCVTTSMFGASLVPIPLLAHLEHLRHFATDPQWHLGSAHQSLTLTKLPTPQRDAKSAGDTISANVQEGTSASSHTSAGTLGAREHTLVGRAPTTRNELLRAHTPLRHSQFERELANHPDKAWVSRLLNGIKMGVDIGYRGPRGPQDSPNLSSAYQHPNIIQAELQKELDAGRVQGPFPARPMPSLHCSGLGVVPKKGNKWRMILHLSAPPNRSINDFISKEEFSLQYTSLDDAISIVTTLGPGALMAKVDLKSAFRMIPVRSQDWELLGMYWQGNYYFDTCLPFGLRSAPYLFNQYAEALAWILYNNYNLSNLIHYLDDYFLAGPPGDPTCGLHLQRFLQVCLQLGAPIATQKIEGPTTIITFLGLELDSSKQQIRLPTDKLQDLLSELDSWLQRKKTTKRELLSLIGKLSFAAKAIPAGRIFTRRLISLSTTASRLHHHLRLNKQAREDLLWWQKFLPAWNGTAHFIDPTSTPAPDLDLFTDASGTIGCGAYFQGNWFHYPWQPHQKLSSRTSIQWQELFAILAATLTWGHLWYRKRIRFFCDNLAVVEAWQNMSAKHPQLLTLLRLLLLHAAQHNFTVNFKHLPGKVNKLADALSRQQFTRFFSLAPQASKEPTATPGVLTTL